MMRGRLKIKSGQVRAIAAAIATGVLLVAFQNCAQPMCAKGDTSCADSGGTSGSSSGSKNGNSNSGSNGGGISMGSGGGSSSGSSSGAGGISVGGGGGSSSGGSGVSIGGGGSGSSGGSSGGGGSAAFGFSSQPGNMMIREGEKLELKVSVNGGKFPFTYQWYRNSIAIGDYMGNYATYTLEESTLKDGGSYFIEVIDASGARIRSSAVDITIVEKPIGCDAGSYFTYTAANFDIAYNYIPEYFDGPRGKYLLHQKFDPYNFFYSTSSNFTGMRTYNVPALAYKAQTYMSCQTSIPRIHTPTANPAYEYYGDRYTDGNGYRYTGNILFECRNNKLLLVSNTCKWSR